jgi:hypothetical protein
MIRISRRDFAVLGVAAVLERSALAQTDAGPIITGAIPSTGERVAAVGPAPPACSIVMTKRPGAPRQRSSGCWLRPADRHCVDLWRRGECTRERDRARGLARQGLHRHQTRQAKRGGAQTFAGTPEDGEALDLLRLHNVAIRANRWHSSTLGRRSVCRDIGIISTFHGDFAAIEPVLGQEKPDLCRSIGQNRKSRLGDPAALDRGGAGLSHGPIPFPSIVSAILRQDLCYQPSLSLLSTLLSAHIARCATRKREHRKSANQFQ